MADRSTGSAWHWSTKRFDGSELLAECVESLLRYKLRTVLAIIGVVIGIAAVTAVVSVVNGARREVVSQMELLGMNNVVLRPKDSFGADGRRGEISLSDVNRLPQLVPFAVAWSPLLETVLRVNGPARAVDASVLGVAPGFQGMMRVRAAQGRLLANLDADRERRVCVLGSELSSTLFAASSPVGRTIEVGGTPCTVVGVLRQRQSAERSGGTLSPRNLNLAVLTPATGGRLGGLFGSTASIAELWLQMPDEVSVVQGGAIAAYGMRQLHHGVVDTETLIPLELLQQKLRAQRTFSLVLGSVAGLALLIGGIGIMNTMLASVLERTSEIGLRRTVGATRRHIWLQFLLESTCMAGAGGVLGILLGIAGSFAITRYAGWPTDLSLGAIMLASATSCATGIFFGTYPARRAASLEPVDAVRFE